MTEQILLGALIVGLLKGIDLGRWLWGRRNGTGPGGRFTKLDCLQGQLNIKEALDMKLDGFRAELKEGLKEYAGAVKRHEDTWHKG